MIAAEQAIRLLPEELGVTKFPFEAPEELRIRIGRKPTALYHGSETEIGNINVSEAVIQKIIERATGASLHSHTEELRNGYINYNGLRIGLCGEAVVQDRRVTGFRGVSSLNIRIPTEIHGICKNVLDRLHSTGADSTLIISPPGGGKTTALRELVRCLSNEGHRISVVDERGELSAYDRTFEGFDLGRYTDVLTNVPKEDGALIMLRAMNPEYIAMDEITSSSDIAAIGQIIGCGVKILATAHGRNLDELSKRPLYAGLLGMDIFRYVVTVSCDQGVRSYRVEEVKCKE